PEHQPRVRRARREPDSGARRCVLRRGAPAPRRGARPSRRGHRVAARVGEDRAERGVGVRRDPRGVRPVDVGRRDTTHRLAGRRGLLRRGKRVAARAGPDLQQRDSSHRREEGDHGMTPPDWTSTAREELAVLGGETYIRVGTTAALQPEIECGDIVISSGAMRHDGTSQYYVDPAYPAVAHYAVTAALVEAAERLGLRYHVGVS